MRELTSRDGGGAIGCMHEQNRVCDKVNLVGVWIKNASSVWNRKVEGIEKFTG